MAMKGYSTFANSGTSPSDCFMSHPGHLLDGGGSYPSAEMLSAYSTAAADWATDLCIKVQRVRVCIVFVTLLYGSVMGHLLWFKILWVFPHYPQVWTGRGHKASRPCCWTLCNTRHVFRMRNHYLANITIHSKLSIHFQPQRGTKDCLKKSVTLTINPSGG